MTKKITVWVLGLTLCISWSGCFLLKISSRRDKYIKTVHRPAQATAKLRAALGEPDEKASALAVGSEVVLEFSQPAYAGYSQSLTVYVPKRYAGDSEYRLLISDRRAGPWIPVGVASSTKTFDIDGTPLAISKYARLEVLKSSRSQLWLDAVKLRVHTKQWKPPILFQSNLKPDQASAEFTRLWKSGKELFGQRRFQQARDRLLGALQLRHKHAPVLYLLGGTYFAMDEYYQSIRHYEMALQYGSPSREHLQELGSSYIALKSYARALPYVQRCMLIAPLYPACYYKRLHLASFERNRKVMAFYREIYRMVKKRTHIQSRKWTLQQFLSRYFSKRAPMMSLYPNVFGCRQHLEWANFLLRLFPSEQKSVLFFTQTGLDTRWKMQTKPHKRRDCAYYRAVYFSRFKQYSKSVSLLRRLAQKEKRSAWLSKIYLFHGELLESTGREKRAMKLYKEAKRRLGATPYGRVFFVKLMEKSMQQAGVQPRKKPPARR